MKSIAIVDWGWVGHVPLYAENLCRLLERAGWGVHHICPTPAEAEQDLCVDGHLRVTCHSLDEPAGDPRAQRTLFGLRRKRVKAEVVRNQSLRRTFQRLSKANYHFDFIFLPWLDLLMSDRLKPDDLPPEFEAGWGGILINACMFSSVATPRQRRAKLQRKFRPLGDNQLKLLATLDELALSDLTDRYPHASVRWMPDLIESPVTVGSGEKKMQLAKESGKQILVSVGVMHRRKGFLKLLNIAERGGCENWFFLIAGPVAGDDLDDQELQLIRRVKAGHLSNAMIVDQQLSVTAVNAFVEGADAVFLGYEDWYQSSNIMTRASHLGTPIFSCPDGLLAQRTQESHLGWVLPDLSVDAIMRSLRAIGRDEISQMRSRAAFDQYAAVHHVDSLSETLRPLLDETNGNRQAA